MTSFSCELF